MTGRSHGSAENPHAGEGSVLLDIGDDVGALVVDMPRGMDGVEVEARSEVATWDQPTHGHLHHPHVAVVERPVVDGTQPSLVFPELREGSYGLGLKGWPEVLLTATVRGGEVTTLSWPG